MNKHQEIDSELSFYGIIEGFADPLVILDRNLYVRYVNQACKEILGFDAVDIISKPFLQFSALKNPSEIENDLANTFATPSGLNKLTITIQNHSKEWFIFEVNAKRLSRTENQAILVLHMRDVTALTRTERSLKENEEKYRTLLNSQSDAIFLHEVRDQGFSRFIEVNDAAIMQYGYSREEFSRLTPADITVRSNIGQHGGMDSRKQPMADGQMVRESVHIKKSGEHFPVEINSAVVELHGSRYMLATVRDISGRKLAEKALRESEQRFRLALKNAPVSVAAQDRSLRYFWAFNQRTAPSDGIIGKTDHEIFIQEEADHIAAMKRRVLDENVELREQMWLTRPGGPIFLDVTWQPIHDEQGTVQGVASATVDLTPLKRAEEGLKASLAEKEVLLKEIHHRVKNNMQVISSLVDMQAEEVNDPAMRIIFQDVIYRVRSMAMVHEKLYHSADLAQVDFGDYAQSLLSYLCQAQGSAASGIALSMTLTPVVLSVNIAVPCGLILNELFSNALKHAFKGRKSGTVTVSLNEDANGNIRLFVGDDGVGFPPGMDWQTSRSLGLRIVRTLARQLQAKVEIRKDQGTQFILSFAR